MARLDAAFVHFLVLRFRAREMRRGGMKMRRLLTHLGHKKREELTKIECEFESGGCETVNTNG
jgi:hypothetical protein